MSLPCPSRTLRALVPLLLAALAGGAAEARAQQSYTIQGTVVDATTQRPLSSVSVLVRGTQLGSLTNNEGRFTLIARLQPGTYTVQYTLIGRGQTTQQITLGGERTVLVPQVELTESAVQLEEIVVTGSGAPTTRRALGNAVATVSGRDVSEAPAATTVDQALQGKVPGAQIMASSGTPGGGVSVRLRGTSSIIGGAEPLYIVDGVIVNNSTDAPGGINFGYRQNPSNRLADLDPNDIERVEILKGAAAAALYGSRANNGVVQIFTKRGRAGAPQITASTRATMGWRPKSLPFNMAPTDASGAPVQRFDNESLIFREALSNDSYVSVRGGNEETQYYLSGAYTNTQGIMKGSDHEKVNVRLNVDQSLASWLKISGGANYITSNTDLVINGEQGVGGLLTAVVFTPTTVDFSKKDPETGRYAVRATTFPNPLEVIDDWAAPQEISRFVGSFKTTAQPTSKLNLEYRLGYDTYNLNSRLFIPRGTPADPDGGVQAGVQDQYLINNDLVGSYIFDASPSLALTSTAGMNHTYSQVENISASASDLSLFTDLVRGAIQAASQNRFETATLGYFLQEQLAWRDRFFLTGALRWDASSTFGADERWQLYPKVSGSYVVSDEDFWTTSPMGSWFSSLRVRSALGYAGNQPPVGSAYSRFPLYTQVTNVNRLGLVHLGQAGNPNLKPERQREWEAGFDASFLNDHVGLAFTYYDQYVTDLLLDRPFAPSTGYDEVLGNVGELSNKGIELQLTSVNVDRPELRWSSTFNFARNRNRVEKLSGDPFNEGYFNRVQEGEALGVWYLYDFARDADGNIQLTDQGLPTRASSRSIVGDPNPDFTASLNNEFRIGGNLRANVLLDGVFGHDVWNQTVRIMDIFQAGPTAEAEILGEVPTGYRAARTRIEASYLEDGTYVKLREVSLRYTLDRDIVPIFGQGTAELELAGRNLFTWTDYTGYDPEINLFGSATVARGTDFAVYPNPRQFSVGIRVNY